MKRTKEQKRPSGYIRKPKDVDRDAKGKELESLRASREIRGEFKKKFGFVPESIIVHKKSEKAIDLNVVEGGRSYSGTRRERWKEQCKGKNLPRNAQQIFQRSMPSNVQGNLYRSGIDTSSTGARHGALSTFPQNIGRLFFQLYSKEGDIVYDPFAGHNSRMQLCWEAKRNYVGVDISHEFMEANRIIKDKYLFKKNKKGLSKQHSNTCTIDLIECSSDEVKLPSNYADFTITSPPYWDIEYYGPEKEQLGMNSTYEGFLKAISKHIKENFRILKPGAKACWFVNDFRKGGEFYWYSADLAPIFREAGFKPFAVNISDLGSTIGQIFVRGIVKSGILPKRHEYCIVVEKPKKIGRTK